MIIGSSVLAVGRARFPFGEGGSWFAGHSYLVQSGSLSLVLPGESVCPLVWQRIHLDGGWGCRTGLHNFMHPRTDPVVITAILDETGDRILLGRNVRNLPLGTTLTDSYHE